MNLTFDRIGDMMRRISVWRISFYRQSVNVCCTGTRQGASHERCDRERVYVAQASHSD